MNGSRQSCIFLYLATLSPVLYVRKEMCMIHSTLSMDQKLIHHCSRNRSFTTPVESATPHPTWGQKHSFSGLDQEELFGAQIEVTVWNFSHTSKHECIGESIWYSHETLLTTNRRVLHVSLVTQHVVQEFICVCIINAFNSFIGKTAFNCGTPGFDGSLQWYPLYSADSNSNEIATVLHLHKHHQQQHHDQQEQYHEQERQQQRQVNLQQMGKYHKPLYTLLFLESA